MNTKDYQKIIKRQDLNIHFDTKARVLSRSDWCPFEHRLKMLRLLIFLRIVFAEIFSHFLFPRAAIKVLPNKMAKLVSRSLPVLLLNLWHQLDWNKMLLKAAKLVFRIKDVGVTVRCSHGWKYRGGAILFTDIPPPHTPNHSTDIKCQCFGAKKSNY